MQKFEFNTKQITFRLDADKLEKLTEIVNDLQEKRGLAFTSQREAMENFINAFVMLQANDAEKQKILNDYGELLEKYEALQQENEAPKIEIPKEIQAKFSEIKETVFDNEELSELQMLENLMEIISTPTPAVEIEKEVIKEVEKPLSPGELRVQLSENQKSILETIARWRAAAGKDTERKTLEDTFIALVFNVGTLTNDHGAYATGLRYNRAKQKLVSE